MTFRDPIYVRRRAGCFGVLWLGFFVILAVALATQYPWIAGGIVAVIVAGVWYNRYLRQRQRRDGPGQHDNAPPQP